MALHCPTLLHSCLAVSAKQMTRAPQSSSPMLEHSPIFYYRQALQEMSHFLIEPRYSGSDELLASSIILSTYEILDVAGESFGSHLKGVASLIRSHRINGDETGIRGATYWTWYRHEVWVAFQARRQMFLDEEYWRPKAVDTFEGISIRDIANRVLFLFGQCITYCITSTKRQSTEDWTGAQQRRAKELGDLLEDWKMKLPRSMATCCMEQPSKNMEEYQLPSVWFAYPESAVSHQLYHTSKILLTLHRPSTSDTAHDPFHTRRELEKSRREVFMVANSKIHETWGLISTQCLYIAGLVTDGVLERQRTLELIELCQKTSGRQTICIADQLREFWKVG
ncbi:hypothetical protein MW887_000868 [Aspergillus wentii]|nr:hypothetical protein MW887_000868 [Aspergillus wentii]